MTKFAWGKVNDFEDQKSGAIMNPAFWQHMIKLSDISHVNASALMLGLKCLSK